MCVDSLRCTNYQNEGAWLFSVAAIHNTATGCIPFTCSEGHRSNPPISPPPPAIPPNRPLPANPGRTYGTM
jgi:hypothetical protein